MPAGYEIERRFLVRVAEELWAGLGDALHLRQGYIPTSGAVSVRIRTGEPRGPVLAVKRGSGLVRKEVETVVTEEIADALFDACQHRTLEKVRFRVGRWELDRFMGALDGLALLEVELGRVDEELPEPPRDVVILSEVTTDNRFTSAHLAHLSHDDRKAFVTQVYEEVSG